MSAFPMRCRYDEGHGTFTNGISLRQHYDAQHPEYVPKEDGNKRRGTCSDCLLNVSRGSFLNHQRKMHGGSTRVRFIDDGGAGAVSRSALPAPVPASKPSRTSQAHTAGSRDHPVIKSVDDLILPMIEVLAMPGKVVPVEHLGALFLWRDQTAEMMRAVRG